MHIEQHQPKDYGFEQTERNKRLFDALQYRVGCLVLNDAEDVSKVITLFKELDHKNSIIELDLKPDISLQETLHRLIITNENGWFETKVLEKIKPYIVIRRIDKFLHANNDKLNGLTTEQDLIVQVLVLATKYGGGMMVTLEGNSRRVLKDYMVDHSWFLKFMAEFDVYEFVE